MDTIGNFLNQPNKDFPLDCDTLSMLQTNTALVAALGNIAGDKLILTGCELTNNGTQRAAGYVFVKTQSYPHGEVLHWEGGPISVGMCLKQQDIAVTAQGFDYPKAYTRRSLVPGVGDEFFKWDDFKKPKTSAELEKQIEALSKVQSAIVAQTVAEPLGVIKMWAGARIPENYALCDGAMLKISEYPELYDTLGTAFNAGANYNGTRYTTQSGFFRLPDLRGRFIVGYNDLDDEYKRYGNVGGEKRHVLTIQELPSHTHGQNLWQEGDGKWKGGGNNSSPNSTSIHNKTTLFGRTESTGDDAGHENRPPYYTLAYIIKIR